MTTLLAVVGDLHVNSTVALMPPMVTLDDGQTVIPSDTQKWLWSNWLDYWNEAEHYKWKYEARVIGIILGDWGDMNTHTDFQLIEPANTDVVLDMMVAAVEPMRKVCDKIIVIRGTEAHTLGVGWLENRAAKEIGAVQNEAQGTHSWFYFKGFLEGVRFTAAHHPGTNSTVPNTRGNEANRRAHRDVYDYAKDVEKPDFSLWGHYHHFADSYDTHATRAIYNGCWKGKDSFTHRLGAGSVKDRYGGLFVFLRDGRYHVIKRAYEVKDDAWVTL